VQDGLRDGSSAVLVHMTKDQALNGQRVKVVSFDGKSGRYVVKLKDGTMRKVKEEHLKEAPDEERHLARIWYGEQSEPERADCDGGRR
jgi:hypothetical protein